MFLNPQVDPVRFSTSWLFTARTLFFIRALLSLYAFTVNITSEIYYAAHDHDPAESGQQFSYFTILTYWGLAFYFAFAAFHAATYWFCHGRPALASWGAVLMQLHSIFYSTIVVFPFVVTSKFVIFHSKSCSNGTKCSGIQMLTLDFQSYTGHCSSHHFPPLSRSGKTSPSMV